MKSTGRSENEVACSHIWSSSIPCSDFIAALPRTSETVSQYSGAWKQEYRVEEYRVEEYRVGDYRVKNTSELPTGDAISFHLPSITHPDQCHAIPSPVHPIPAPPRFQDHPGMPSRDVCAAASWHPRLRVCLRKHMSGGERK